MTKIIYFVTPTTLVKLGSKAAEFLPIVGPSLEFTKKAKKMTQLTDPVSASSSYNDTIEVQIVFEDGFSYTVFVTTPDALLDEMSDENKNFIKAGNPKIIVNELTTEIVREAIKDYAKNNCYWLKLSRYADEIDISVLNRLEAKDRKEMAEFKLLTHLASIRDEINKLDKLNKSKKLGLVARLDKLYKYLNIITFRD
jgi:hypothetical protein